jgi:hypothetical protein
MKRSAGVGSLCPLLCGTSDAARGRRGVSAGAGSARASGRRRMGAGGWARTDGCGVDAGWA